MQEHGQRQRGRQDATRHDDRNEQGQWGDHVAAACGRLMWSVPMRTWMLCRGQVLLPCSAWSPLVQVP
jgi:hypothetical protein